MNRDRTSGAIAVGKDADLIIIDGDPLADIRDLRNVVTTVRGGVRYSPAAIYETLGIRPAGPSEARPCDRVHESGRMAARSR